MLSIIGLVGFIGCGKGTVSNILVNDYGYIEDSFASTVKDVCSSIFGWPRHLLEGDTLESRQWRDTVDIWWSKNLNIEKFTPRKALTMLATDVIRNNFNKDIWYLSLLNRMRNFTNTKIVISDARFINEIKFIKDNGGKIIRIKRGPEPDWYQLALDTNIGKTSAMHDRTDIHESEWQWIGSDFDYIINNDGTIDNLKKQINDILTPYNS
jgi:hypothetical protein